MLSFEKAPNGKFLIFESENEFCERKFEIELTFDEFLCSYRDRPFL